MKYEIGGLVILIIGIGLIRYGNIFGAVTVIIGASIMMKGKRTSNKYLGSASK